MKVNIIICYRSLPQLRLRIRDVLQKDAFNLHGPLLLLFPKLWSDLQSSEENCFWSTPASCSCQTELGTTLFPASGAVTVPILTFLGFVRLLVTWDGPCQIWPMVNSLLKRIRL